MAANSTHPDYDAKTAEWSRARDVLAGEAAGTKYLPRLDSQNDEEYAAYKARASFFGATARTLEEYLDLVFRRAPALGLGERKTLEAFAADSDLWGLDIVRYARRVVGEVLSVGRAGSLVLRDEAAKRPCVSFWRAEDIINWRVERVGQAVTPVEVVLRDCGRLRVLRLVDAVCIEEFLSQGGGAWVLDESAALKRDGTALTFIPFVFNGPRGSRPEPDRLPLADIIAANLDHCRLDADFKHGLHFAALGQWWLEGGDLDGQAARFAMSTDLGARAMSGEEIGAVVAAWRAGAVSRDTMLERLKRGEVLSDGRSVAQERALIHETQKVGGES